MDKKLKHLFKNISLSLTALTILMSSGIAVSDPVPPKSSIGLIAGTTGLGIQVNYQVNDRWSASAFRSTHNMNHNYNSSINDIENQFGIDFDYTGLYGNYHLHNKGLRITAGIIHNDSLVRSNQIYSHIVPFADTYVTYDIAEIDIEGRFKKLSPYLGIGYTKALKNLEFRADLGVIYQGHANVKLNSKLKIHLSDSDINIINASLEKERKLIQKELDKLRYYPVAIIGVAYKF